MALRLWVLLWALLESSAVSLNASAWRQAMQDRNPRALSVELCPPWDGKQRIKTEHGSIQKYELYARLQCKQASDLWQKLTPTDHKLWGRRVFHELQVQPGEFVLDWGSGCGTKMRMLESIHKARGLGIDFSGPAVDYALQQSDTVGFCHTDGAQLGWIPDGAFDHAVSFGALYHLWSNSIETKNQTKMCHRRKCVALGDGTGKYSSQLLCEVTGELVRVTGPSGKVVISAMLWSAPKQYFQDCWAHSLLPRWPGLGLKIVDEVTFSNGKYGNVYWGRNNMFRAPTDRVYTVILCKGRPDCGTKSN